MKRQIFFMFLTLLFASQAWCQEYLAVEKTMGVLVSTTDNLAKDEDRPEVEPVSQNDSSESPQTQASPLTEEAAAVPYTYRLLTGIIILIFVVMGVKRVLYLYDDSLPPPT